MYYGYGTVTQIKQTTMAIPLGYYERGIPVNSPCGRETCISRQHADQRASPGSRGLPQKKLSAPKNNKKGSIEIIVNCQPSAPRQSIRSISGCMGADWLKILEWKQKHGKKETGAALKVKLYCTQPVINQWQQCEKFEYLSGCLSAGPSGHVAYVACPTGSLSSALLLYTGSAQMATSMHHLCVEWSNSVR